MSDDKTTEVVEEEVVIVCDNGDCEYEVDPVEEEVSANYCGFDCAIEAEDFITGIFIKLQRNR